MGKRGRVGPAPKPLQTLLFPQTSVIPNRFSDEKLAFDVLFHNKSSFAHHCERIRENCKTLFMRQKRRYYAYILASKGRVLYTGVTGLLMSRVLCHKRGEGGCFTRKYQVNRLVWFQSFELVSAAIARFLPTPKAGSSPLKRIRNDSD